MQGQSIIRGQLPFWIPAKRRAPSLPSTIARITHRHSTAQLERRTIGETLGYSFLNDLRLYAIFAAASSHGDLSNGPIVFAELPATQDLEKRGNFPLELEHFNSSTNMSKPDKGQDMQLHRPYSQGRPFRRRHIKNQWIRRVSKALFGVISGFALGFIMLSLWKYFVGLSPLLGVYYPAFAAPANLSPRDLDSFVTSERAIALDGVLANIGPDGSKAPGAAAGYVVASPSKTDPPCK